MSAKKSRRDNISVPAAQPSAPAEHTEKTPVPAASRQVCCAEGAFSRKDTLMVVLYSVLLLLSMTVQTVQSLYAIGSGGLKGLGLGNSVEKQLWLPESTNDFIFSVVCEELGFIGAVLIIVLFILLIAQGLMIAYKAENQFCTMVGIGIMAQIAWQVFCNIAVVTNTIPNTGISLPMFSYGGTSLCMILGELGILLAVSRQGIYEKE